MQKLVELFKGMNAKDVLEVVVELGIIMSAIAAVIRYLSASPLEELYMEGAGKTVLKLVRILERVAKLGFCTFILLFIFYLVVNYVCIRIKFKTADAVALLIVIGIVVYFLITIKDSDAKDFFYIIMSFFIIWLIEFSVIFSLVLINANIGRFILTIVMQSKISSEMLLESIKNILIVVVIDAFSVMFLDVISYKRIAKYVMARRARIVLRIADKSNPAIHKWLYVYELIGDNLVCGKEEDYNRNTCIELIPMTELTRDEGNRYTLLQLQEGHKEWKRKILKFKFEPTRSWAVE